MNATDAGSGRRVLISQFALRGAPNGPIRGRGDHPVSVLSEGKNPKAKEYKKIDGHPGCSISRSVQRPASAPAFPGMTPAATIDVSDGRFGSKHRKIRLVDGGYVEDSGVETVLDLLQSTRGKFRQERHRAQCGRKQEVPPGRATLPEDPGHSHRAEWRKLYGALLLRARGNHGADQGAAERARLARLCGD